MLRLFKTHYLKSRVINNSYYLEKVMIEMAKQSLENPDEKFLEIDASRYYESKFLSYIAPRWSIDRSLFSKSELEKYEESVKKLEEFRALYHLMEDLSELYWEIKQLYESVSKTVSTPNFWDRNEYTTQSWKEDVEEALKKYHNLMKALKGNDLWEEKVKLEVGYYAHLIYSSLNHSEEFKTLFTENFDEQFFFK